MTQTLHPDTTLRVPAARFERSPYADRYMTDDAIHGVYADRFYPISLGHDETARYWSLRRDVVLYDVPEKPLAIDGPDAARFLDHVLTRPVSSLSEGRARYALACAPDGGIVMDGIVFRRGPKAFWFVQADGPMEAWLAAHAGGFDVTISDPASRVLQLQGPASKAILSRATDGAIEDMGYFHAATVDLGGQDVFVSRTGWTGELGYEIYGHPDLDHGRLWDHLMDAGADDGLVVDGVASMGIRRIEAGILDNGTDMDRTMTPFAAGLGSLVDFDRDDFVGRAALEAAPRGRRLFGLTCADARPAAGARVLDGDTCVGRVTSGAWSPTLERGVAFVRFEDAGDWVGRALTLCADDTDPAPCEIVTPPFYDPEKKIARGVDTARP